MAALKTMTLNYLCSYPRCCSLSFPEEPVPAPTGAGEYQGRRRSAEQRNPNGG